MCNLATFLEKWIPCFEQKKAFQGTEYNFKSSKIFLANEMLPTNTFLTNSFDQNLRKINF